MRSRNRPGVKPLSPRPSERVALIHGRGLEFAGTIRKNCSREAAASPLLDGKPAATCLSIIRWHLSATSRTRLRGHRQGRPAHGPGRMRRSGSMRNLKIPVQVAPSRQPDSVMRCPLRFAHNSPAVIPTVTPPATVRPWPSSGSPDPDWRRPSPPVHSSCGAPWVRPWRFSFFSEHRSLHAPGTNSAGLYRSRWYVEAIPTQPLQHAPLEPWRNCRRNVQVVESG